jgi:hypothetical protein
MIDKPIKPLTESQVRKIAREETAKLLAQEMVVIKEELRKQGDILARLERLLLGETGVSENETLKWKANFAYQYARMNTESKVIERAGPALDWFEDMNTTEPGCKETRMESLGKLITFYTNIRWFLALIGITTLLNALPVIKTILEWLKVL